jgi:hypothetical protein
MMCSKRWLSAALAAVFATLLAAAAVAADAERAPQTYFYFVFSNPVAGREDEYNRWYDEQHAPDVVSIPGFMSAQRFVLSDLQLREVALKKPKYLVVYRIITTDLAALGAEVNRRLASGQTRMSSSFDAGSAMGITYRALAPEKVGAGAGGASAAAAPGALTYYQFVFADPATGRDADFNHWYDTYHGPEVAAVSGFVSWQRGVLSEQQLNPPTAAPRYLAMFRIVTSDLPAVFADFQRRAPGMSMSAAFDGDRTFGYTYRAIGPLLSGEQVRAQRAHGAR